MKFRMVHNLPQRMRIILALPKRHIPDNSQIERLFLAVDGVQKVSFNGRTRSLLIRYNGDSAVRVVLLKIIKETPLIFETKENPEQNKLKQKKRAVVLSGVLLIARPIIPFVLTPVFALYGAMPVLKKGFRATLNRRLNVDTLDSAAIGISLLRGGLPDCKLNNVLSQGWRLSRRTDTPEIKGKSLENVPGSGWMGMDQEEWL